MRKKLLMFGLLLLGILILGGCKKNSVTTDSPTKKEQNSEQNQKNEQNNSGEVDEEFDEIAEDGDEEQIDNGFKRTVDLNNDGKEEEIILTMTDDAYMNYKLAIGDISIEGSGDSIEPEFNIVDLNKSDTYLEIAVSEYGPMSDSATTFYWFNGEKIQQVGKIQGFFDSDGSFTEVVIDGTGIVKGLTRGTLLHAWFFEDSYELQEGHVLVNVPKDLYVMNSSVTLKEDLELYSTQDEGANTFKVSTGDKLTIVASDNKKWCLIKTDDGQQGWFTVDEQNKINGSDRSGQDVFEGLMIIN